MTRRRAGLLGAALLLAGLGLADAFWLEPRVLLVQDEVRIDLPAPPLRAALLSDLHISEDRPQLRKLLAEIARARPDVVLISGDLLRDVPEPEPMARHVAATAAFLAALRRTAPILAVQGHSEHQGAVIGAFDRAGVEWLSNEGRRIGPGGGLLLLGLNQQVGFDHLGRSWPSPFRPVRAGRAWTYGARWGDPFRNAYSHYDPQPAGLTDPGGPLAWSGYEVVCDAWIDNEDVGAGIAFHSRFVLGEDRMYRLRRARPERGNPGSYVLVAHGTTLAGDVDTGVDPEPGRWYRLRVRTEALPDRVRIAARVWPADRAEPRQWQARTEDRTPYRVTSGTVGLWSWGGGTVAYRHLKVTSGGETRLDAPLAGNRRPEGFRDGTRGTRLALALARSPYVPPGTPRVVLAHTPDVVREASLRGLDAVLAGHTHGGQVRLPFVGALTTRDTLGPRFDFGRFEFAAPNPRGLTSLFITAGLGTSVLPVRFWCPPRWALVELGNPEAGRQLEVPEVLVE